MKDERKIRVFIVDDHPIVQKGLCEFIAQERDLVVCGTASDAPSALDGIRSTKPDVAIVDISLGGVSGLQLIKSIRAHAPDVSVLVLSMHDERVYAERALNAGAQGYIMKQEATETIVAAMRQIARGEIYLSEALAARRPLTATPGEARVAGNLLEVLTDREIEVFRLIGQGYKTREIGERLFLSPKTIETYRENIKEKLNLADAGELSRAAIAWVHGDRQV